MIRNCYSFKTTSSKQCHQIHRENVYPYLGFSFNQKCSSKDGANLHFDIFKSNFEFLFVT